MVPEADARDSASAPEPAVPSGDRSPGRGFGGRAEASHRPVVLHVAVDVIGDVVVHGDVVHLADGERNAARRFPVIIGHEHPAVVGDEDAAGVGRVDPDVMGVPAPGQGPEGLASIRGLVEAAVGHEDLIGVSRRNSEPDIVAGAPDQGSLPAPDFPIGAAVVRTPDGALVGGLDKRINAPGILGRDGHIDLSDGGLGQAVALQALPGGAAVAGNIDAAPGPAAEQGVGVHLHLPHAGEQHLGVIRVHRQARAARIRVDEKHALPALAAVGRAVDPAFLLGAREAAERGGEDDVRIGRVDDDAADAAGLVEPHVRPGLSGVGRPIDPVAHHVHVADGPGLAGPGPDGAGIGRGHGQRPDRGHRLAVENRIPTVAAVGGLPDAAGSRPDVVGVRVAGNARGGRDPVADGRTHEAEPQPFGRADLRALPLR